MEKFNLIFKCMKGEYKLEQCTKFPTKKDLEESIESLSDIGLGKIKEISIIPLDTTAS